MYTGHYNTINIPVWQHMGENLKIALSQPIGKRQQKALPGVQLTTRKAGNPPGNMGYLGAKYPMFSGPVLPLQRTEEVPAGLILSRKTYILKIYHVFEGL
jgi:hypothetical protein